MVSREGRTFFRFAVLHCCVGIADEVLHRQRLGEGGGACLLRERWGGAASYDQDREGVAACALGESQAVITAQSDTISRRFARSGTPAGAANLRPMASIRLKPAAGCRTLLSAEVEGRRPE